MASPSPVIECQTCRSQRISALRRLTAGVCKLCAQAGETDRWHAEHRRAQDELERLSTELGQLAGEDRESRRGRRLRKRVETASRSEARSRYRLLASELAADVRRPDQGTLAELDAVRRRASFGAHDSEPEHWFRVYLTRRLDDLFITAHERDEIVAVLSSMTGLSDLDEAPVDLRVDVAIALANAGELDPVLVPEDVMILAPDEAAFVYWPAELCEHSRVQVSEVAKAGFTVPVAPGATIGTEQAHTVTAERPGDLRPVTDGVVVVTTERTVFVNGRTLHVPHGNLLRLGAERHFCLLHHTGAPSPVVLRAGNAGALVVASINMARRRLQG